MTDDEIFDGVIDYYANRDFISTYVKPVAEYLGYAHPTLFQRFTYKSLAAGAVARIGTRLEEKLEELGALPPLAGLSALAEWLVQGELPWANTVLFLQRDAIARDRDPAIAEAAILNQEKLEKWTRQRFERLQADGVIRTAEQLGFDPASQFLALTELLPFSVRMGLDGANNELLLDWFMRGIEVPQAS